MLYYADYRMLMKILTGLQFVSPMLTIYCLADVSSSDTKNWLSMRSPVKDVVWHGLEFLGKWIIIHILIIWYNKYNLKVDLSFLNIGVQKITFTNKFVISRKYIYHLMCIFLELFPKLF